MEFSLLQNILLGLSLAAPFGPVNVEIVKRGLNSGFKQAFVTGLGAMTADTTYLTIIFFGLVSFLKMPLLKIFFALAGSLILIYLGVTSIKDFLGKTDYDENRIGGFLKIPTSPVT
jgi:threonine/homoserine/homoserine lactone efflux protein